MIRTFTKQLLSAALSLLLVIATVPFEAGGQQSPSTGSNGYSGEGAPLSTNELQQLVAPIALYPDALVAQVFGAATFPDQIAYANDWLQQNKNLSGTPLMQAVDAQPWDPSIKALTQFLTFIPPPVFRPRRVLQSHSHRPAPISSHLCLRNASRRC